MSVKSFHKNPGEANFDINRGDIPQGQMLLSLEEFRPSKVTAFERALEQLLRDSRLTDEVAVMRVCFEHGVKRQHAAPVLARLKKEGVIKAEFRVPDIHRLNSPREIRMNR